MNTHLPAARELTPWDEIDVVSEEGLLRLCEVKGPCVSVYLHTPVFGPDTRQGPSWLRTLARDAAGRLRAAGVDDQTAADVLEPFRTLEDDPAFWEHQGPGLALFTAPGFAARLRLPVAVEEQVVVGAVFRLAPLVPLLNPSSGFLVLALAQNAVRLLHGSREGIVELPLHEIPGSMKEAIPQEEMERHGQSHSTGRMNARSERQVHGQGNEADYDKAALERFFRAVDAPLVDRYGRRGEPLVLACVGYYLPIYRQVSHYPTLWPTAVEGNPEHRPAEDLRAAVWELLAAEAADREERQREHYRAVAGTGRTVSDPDELLGAAREGRVDTLFVDPNAGDPEGGLLDAAVVETLRHRGRCVPLGVLGESRSAAALLRY